MFGGGIASPRNVNGARAGGLSATGQQTIRRPQGNGSGTRPIGTIESGNPRGGCRSVSSMQGVLRAGLPSQGGEQKPPPAVTRRGCPPQGPPRRGGRAADPFHPHRCAGGLRGEGEGEEGEGGQGERRSSHAPYTGRPAREVPRAQKLRIASASAAGQSIGISV